MNHPDTCPKCSAKFDARKELVWGGVPVLFGVMTAPGVSTKVRCPKCGYSFSAENVRFFGFLSGPALCLLLLVAAVIGLLSVMLSSFL
jgi:predicted nucleic-acid-binding Zn-ribbon protein